MSEKILVTRSSMPEFEEYCQEIEDLWSSHWLTNMGVKHQRLQNLLEKYMKVPHVELLVNGHMALEMTLQAMRLDGEVITPPFTFASTTHAIIRSGLTPVFCDIDPNNFTIDTKKLEELITDKTCAILPVHVYGNICNVEEIQRIAEKYNLKVIYDAAHAFGETYYDESVGAFGDASCFSFHATKVFNTVEGGAVTFHDVNFGQALYDLKNFGIHGPEDVCAVGANAKMNEFCAAMGICNLRHIDDEIEKRRKVVERYRQHLEGVPGIQLNVIQDGVKSNYAYFPIIISKDAFGRNRDEVSDDLAKEGICVRKYFYPLTTAFECFRGRFDPLLTPIALDISRRVLTLPLYADLSLYDVDRICEVLLREKV